MDPQIANLPEPLRIDNRRYARGNFIVGRILAPLVAMGASATVGVMIGSGHVFTRGGMIGASVNMVIVILMLNIVVRRGVPPQVSWVELGEDLVVGKGESVRRIPWDDVLRMEYEGVRNRTRVPVTDAPFPKDDARVLVITHRKGLALRIRVEWEHDATIKACAERLTT